MKTIRLLRHFILSTAFLAGTAQAAKTPDGNATRGTHWPSIIAAVEDAGITRIGDFDLKKFEEEAQQILWTRIEGAPNTVLSGDRRTAYYIWKGKKVYINDQLPAEASASLAQLELHEALGATGYNDDNYALSTALNTLARLKNPAQRQKLVRSYGRTVFQRRLMMAGEGGGASLVTRGGDLVTLFIKDLVLKAIMGDSQNSSAATPEFLSTYAKIAFEPLQMQNRGLTFVAVQYDRYIQPLPNGEREAFTVFVPMKRWSQGESSRKALIREIVRKVTEIFPAYNGTPLVSFVPRGCPAGTKPVSFPTPTSTGAREIQEQRGALLRNCPDRWNDDGAKTHRAVVAPALPDGADPKQPGHYQFRCLFQYGQATAESQFAHPLGVSTLRTQSWGIEEGDYLGGEIGIGNDGTITAIGISYRAPNAPLSRPQIRAVKNARRASTQMIVNGTPLVFSCKREN